MITMVPVENSNVLFVDIENELTDNDFELLLPEVETMIQRYGSTSLAMEFCPPMVIPFTIIWENVTYSSNHFNERVEKVAVIGDDRLSQMIPVICKPFTKAVTRYYPLFERPQAIRWLLKAEQ